MMRIIAGGTDTGCVRTANQDYHHIDEQFRFVILADGMGGHAGGEVASSIATHTISEYLNAHWETESHPEVLLQEAVSKANLAILRDQAANPARADMGTTLVVVVFWQDTPWFCHIGDSRLYRFRNTRLEQLSEDHTWIARAVLTGAVSAEEARVHPWRHMLLQCLGREDIKPIQARSIDWQPGDRLLLCSDGLTEELSDTRIGEILKNTRSCPIAVQTLIDESKAHGGRDNVTVIVVAGD